MKVSMGALQSCPPLFKFMTSDPPKKISLTAEKAAFVGPSRREMKKAVKKETMMRHLIKCLGTIKKSYESVRAMLREILYTRLQNKKWVTSRMLAFEAKLKIVRS